MAGVSRFRKRLRALYKRQHLIHDMAMATRMSREETAKYLQILDMILEDALCRYTAVETVFGTIKTYSNAKSKQIVVRMKGRQDLEAKLTILRNAED